MRFLKRNNFVFNLFMLVLSGCTTSSFELIKQQDLAAEIKVSPDRVLIECEFQYKDNSGDGYGFLMHILDDENTVLSIVQTNVIDKGSCDRRIEKIGKIIKTGKMIYIGGMGNLKKPRAKENKNYTFPFHGTFQSNGRNAQFIAISNEQGLCYDAYSGEEDPCPGEPIFTLHNLKKGPNPK